MKSEVQIILSKIEEGRLFEAVHSIDKNTEIYSSINNEVYVNIKARLKELERRQVNGLISNEEYDLGLNNIRISLIRTLRETDKHHEKNLIFRRRTGEKRGNSIFVISLVTISLVLLSITGFNYFSATEIDEDLLFLGEWNFHCKDVLYDSTLNEPLEYRGDLTFSLKEDNVLFNGSFNLIKDGKEVNIIPRKVKGKGDMLLDGEYLRILYETTDYDNNGKGFGIIMFNFHPSGKKGDFIYTVRGMLESQVLLTGRGEIYR